MEPVTEVRDLSEDELRARLVAAAADQREGRIVHCATGQALREFMREVRQEPS
jgi:hypothetical protein